MRANGQFIVRATIRSGFGSDNELIRPAAAHYAVAAREGNATVLSATTNARMSSSSSRPSSILRKDAGSKLHFAVRVPGADSNMKVRIVLGKRTLAEGMANSAGRVFATIARPIQKGNLRVIASVPGAETSISDPVPFSTPERDESERVARMPPGRPASTPAGVGDSMETLFEIGCPRDQQAPTRGEARRCRSDI